MGKVRLDVLLVDKGLITSRERAKTTIMAGLVLVNEQKIDKPGTMVKKDANIRLLGENNPFVSRGGFKLQKAIEDFGLDLSGVIMADIGASTGGFTDCSLQNGAVKSYAIDVGYGQLAWSLRSNERVVNLERTNIRYLDKSLIKEPIDFASIDVSFISLEKVLPVAKEILGPQGRIVALIKPQFEAGKEKVGKKGVVREPKIHLEVINKIIIFSKKIGLNPINLTHSPIKGPEGNIEYLILLSPDESIDSTITEELILQVVNDAHANLK